MKTWTGSVNGESERRNRTGQGQGKGKPDGGSVCDTRSGAWRTYRKACRRLVTEILLPT